MKYEIDNPLLWKLFTVIAISMLITCAAGCKNGKRLNTGSSGIIRVITTKSVTEQPKESLKASLPESKRIKAESSRSRPKPVEPKPIKANPVISTPKAAGETKPFQPTISVTPTNVKLPPVVVYPSNKSTLPEPPIKVNVNPKPIMTEPHKPTGPAEGGGTPAGGDEKSSVKIDWVGLGFFYFLVFLVGLGVWTVYDIHKRYKAKKKSS